MGWPFSNLKYQSQVNTLNYILSRYSRSSFYEQCYIVQQYEDLPVEWLVYLALNQQDMKQYHSNHTFFIENKPCRNDFKLLLIRKIGHDDHHFLRMVIDNRYYSKSWLYYNHPTAIPGYRHTSLKKCIKYVKILRKPTLYYRIKFAYYELLESFDNIFLFPPM